MRNTYINDQYLDVFPFASGESLPFPSSCIRYIAAAVYDKTGAYRAPTVTGVSLSDSSVSISFMLGDIPIGTAVGSLTASECKPLIFDSPQAAVHISVMPGIIPVSSFGTYGGNYKLDPQCIRYVSSAEYGQLGSVYVNNVKKELGTSLKLSFSGFLSSSVNGTDVTVTGSVADTDKTNIEQLQTDYSMVTSISGVSVPVQTSEGDFTGELVFSTDVPGVSFNATTTPATAPMFGPVVTLTVICNDEPFSICGRQSNGFEAGEN